MNFLEKLKSQLPENSPKNTQESYTERGNLQVRIKREFEVPFENLPRINYREIEIEIVLKSSEGEKISLITFAPPGYKMIEKQYSALGPSLDSENHIVEFPRYRELSQGNVIERTKDSFVEMVTKDNSETVELHEFLKLRGSFLRILHEFGHAFDYLGVRGFEKVKMNAIRKLSTATMILSESKTVDALDDALLEQYLSNVIQEERDAWVYALRVLRELRKEGVDLEPGLSNHDLLNLLHKDLDSYGGKNSRVQKLKKSQRNGNSAVK